MSGQTTEPSVPQTPPIVPKTQPIAPQIVVNAPHQAPDAAVTALLDEQGCSPDELNNWLAPMHVGAILIQEPAIASPNPTAIAATVSTTQTPPQAKQGGPPPFKPMPAIKPATKAPPVDYQAMYSKLLESNKNGFAGADGIFALQGLSADQQAAKSEYEQKTQEIEALVLDGRYEAAVAAVRAKSRMAAKTVNSDEVMYRRAEQQASGDLDRADTFIKSASLPADAAPHKLEWDRISKERAEAVSATNFTAALDSLKEQTLLAMNIVKMIPDGPKITGKSEGELVAEVEELVKQKNWAQLKAVYRGNTGGTPASVREHIRSLVLKDPVALKAMGDDADLGGEILAGASLQQLQALKLDDLLGDKKNGVVAQALLKLTDTGRAATGQEGEARMDPALFKQLAGQIGPEVWNDKEPGQTTKRGLAARVNNNLWRSGNFDEICDLVDLGVDTTLPHNLGRDTGRDMEGIWSGFIQPMQHLLGNYVKEVGEMRDGKEPAPERKNRVDGAAKILDKLGDKAAILTTWEGVQKSDLLGQFKEDAKTGKQGTIWGFEDVRLPYVQASHEADGGQKPLRMIELWDAVLKTLRADTFEQLVDNPDRKIPEVVEAAAKELEGNAGKYAKPEEIASMKDAFIANFKTGAAAFLREFSQQMPKGNFAGPAKDDAGKVREKAGDVPLRVSEFAGIDPGKFMGGLACKAGLWWAKQEKKPVYYCLDSINIEDALNYKTVKNKAIDTFIQSGGQDDKQGPKQGADAKKHLEVITLVEIREILKNWDELKDTVQFFKKGVPQAGPEFEAEVQAWKMKMENLNKAAGRANAPDKKTFTNELKALDPALLDRIPGKPPADDDEDGSKDARDIVRKASYLVKVAKTRPSIVLKYVTKKCPVLIRYKLIPADVVALGAKVDWLMDLTVDAAGKLNNPALNDLGAIGKDVDALEKCLDGCISAFQAPLKAALVAPVRDLLVGLKS